MATAYVATGRAATSPVATGIVVSSAKWALTAKPHARRAVACSNAKWVRPVTLPAAEECAPNNAQIATLVPQPALVAAVRATLHSYYQWTWTGTISKSRGLTQSL